MSSYIEPPFPFNTTTTTHNHNLTNHHKRRAKTPSFSSILLDAIYRSIDEDSIAITNNSTPVTTTTTTTTTTENNDYSNNIHNHKNHSAKQRRNKMRSDSTLETVDLRRAIMIESWIEKQQDKPQPSDHDDEKITIVRQKSVPAGRSRPSDQNISFSSKIRSSDSCFSFDHAPPSKRVTSSRIFTKTKSRAMKIYGELKKPKTQQNDEHQQPPISPGARIAAFLNSIFRNSGNSPARRENIPIRKENIPASINSTSTSTCSSASSFSRSCLSKTPSSRATSSKSSNKRSVRFYPVSVIVDEDSRPCGQKSLRIEDDDVFRKPLISSHGERKWRREKEIDALMTMIKRNCHENSRGGERKRFGNFDDEEMNDGESCASSDLFELENLSSIGVSRYAEELPVYGTTSLHNLTA